jgi:hypothetical protein
VTKSDVLKLVRAGVGDDVIVARIRAEGVEARPSTDEILEMKKEGVSDKIVQALLEGEVASRVETPRMIYSSNPWDVPYYYPYYPYYRPYSWGGYWPYPYWHFGVHYRIH